MIYYSRLRLVAPGVITCPLPLVSAHILYAIFCSEKTRYKISSKNSSIWEGKKENMALDHTCYTTTYQYITTFMYVNKRT